MKKLKAGKSSIHGRGLFTQEPVKKGEPISFLKGKIRRRKNNGLKDALANSCWIGISKERWIDPDVPFRYINHSCNPSTGVRGCVTMVALRDLKAGDEITLDYSTIEGDPLWYMKCGCGEKSCRKTIRSIKFLPARVFDKYMPFIPTYFKNLYLHSKKV